MGVVRPFWREEKPRSIAELSHAFPDLLVAQEPP